MDWKCKYDLVLKSKKAAVNVIVVDWIIYPASGSNWFDIKQYYIGAQSIVPTGSKPRHEYTHDEVYQLANAAITSSVIPANLPDYDDYQIVVSGSYSTGSFSSGSGFLSVVPGPKVGWSTITINSGSI